MKKLKFIITFYFIACLSGCTTMPISSAIKLKSLSPLNINPNEIGIAVLTDNAIQLTNDSVYIKMSYSSPTTSASANERLLVNINNRAKNLAGIEPQKGRLMSFSLTPESSTKMRLLQKEIKELRSSGIKVIGSFSVEVSGDGCLLSKKPNHIFAKTYIKTKKNEDFFVLNRRVNLTKLSEGTEQSIDKWPLCS